MDIEVTESVIQILISKNIPFVVYREPGNESRLVIQRTKLELVDELRIEKRGFYAFPFSTKERSKPLYFAPDIDINYSERQTLDLDFEPLQISNVIKQDLFEVEEEQYIEDLKMYLDAFKNKGIKKAIYSRIFQDELADDFDLEAYYKKLERNYSKAFVYMMHIPGDGIWLGASPELLLSYEDQMAKTVALAGTLKVTENLSSPEWTRKEIDEHRLVEKHIISLCEELNLRFEKSSVRTSNTGKVYHLKSDFTLRVDQDQIVSFLEKLHPTPAISGLPQSASLDLIYQIEKHDRSYYCGFLGFVDDINRFNLFINLRCMKIEGLNYSLFAGGGITPDSDIEKEWEETKVKMATLTDLMPNSNVDYEEISSVSC